MFHKKLISLFSRENTNIDRRTDKRKIGDVGEKIAAEWLEDKEFSVIEVNYLRPWGEIDIIVRKGTRIHFIEVKTVTRENVARGTREAVPREMESYRPEDNIHPAKLGRLARTVQTYLLEKGIGEEAEWQFDAITVFLDQRRKEARVELLENIVL